jgi:hypothetical protein
VEKSEVLRRHLNQGEEDLYYILTDLEKFYEDFLRTAYLYAVGGISFVAKLKFQPHGSSLILGDR